MELTFPEEILKETRSMVYISWADHIALARMARPRSRPVIQPEREEPTTKEELKAWRKFAEDLGAAVKASMRRRGTLIE